MSAFRLASVKTPFFLPIKTGHRFDEADPTVPTEMLSAARATGGVGRPTQSSPAAVTTERNKPTAALHPRATRAPSAPPTGAKLCRRHTAPDNAARFPSR